MVDAVTNNFSLVQPTVGGDLNIWGGVLNNGVIAALDATLGANLAVSITAADVTLTAAQFQNAIFVCSGVLTGNRSLILPLSPNSATVAVGGRFVVVNNTTGAFTLTVKTVAVGSTGVTVPQGFTAALYSDGTNVGYGNNGLPAYAQSVNGNPNGQLAGTAGSVNTNASLAFDYTNNLLYSCTTTGNTAGAVWTVAVSYTAGANLLLTGSTFSNPAFPPTASFKNLSIKVATTTTITCAADYITVSDGTNFKTLAFSGVINLGTSGALNTLDTGIIAINTWYAIWAIAKADGTLPGFLASTSFSLPTLPSGYTLAARVGAVQTIHATATLYGTWQFGRYASYIAGLAATVSPPAIVNGTVGTASQTSPTLVASQVTGNGFFVPTTASKIHFAMTSTYKGGAGAGNVNLAPSAAYSGTNNGPMGTNGLISPYINGATFAYNISGELTLESNSIYFASGNTGGAVCCLGWEDNI